MIRKSLKIITLSAFGLLLPMLVLAQDVPADQTPPGQLTNEQVMQLAQENPFGNMLAISSIGLVVIIVAAMFFAFQREKRRQDFLARFVDKDQAIPKELLPPTPSPQREMRRGVWLLSLGLGLGMVLYFSSGEWENVAWCLILLLLGAASFINAAFFYPDSSAGRRIEDGD